MPLVNIELWIDGVDRSSLLKQEGFSWEDRLGERSTLNFTLISGGAPPYFIPQIGDPIILRHLGETVFTGSIQSLSEVEAYKEETLFVRVTCVDNDQILDRFLVAFRYEGWLARDIVRHLIENFVDPLELVNVYNYVEDGIVLSVVSFNYRKVSDALRALSDLIGFNWYVDHNRNLRFFDRGSFTAPFDIEEGSANHRNVQFSRTRAKYRNDQYIRAGIDVTDLRTEDFTGDGEIQSFEVVYPVHEIDSITLDVGAGPVAQSYGTREEGDDGAFQWYYREGDKTISQRHSDVPIAAGNLLQIKYHGQYPIIARVVNLSGISNRKDIEGSSGIYQKFHTDRAIEDGTQAEEKAEGFLRKFGRIVTELKYDTDTPGVRAGQLQRVALPDFGDHAVEFFLITKVRTQILGNGVRYKIEAMSGEEVGGWAAFFRKLADSGQDFSLGKGEKLLLLRSSSEMICVCETFSQTDPLGDEDDDPFTGWVWGSATWGKSFWGAPTV